ncbi:hypothetical protein [Actinobacillus minor]|uniref:hypothetical protein n=1 Tax=Actinobacillus minor TaxID=51047 RepID=UPI002A825D93|nr:hypothetical protein [Actinobacillus minor]MDY4712165.1 hypothetical protein [Actinobacillus minor]
MKFQVKTTALAILVSLGVVGCKSNDTPNQVVEPTPANQASKTDAEKKAEADAKAKATAEAKAKAEAEAKAKAEEAKRLEEERKKAEAEAKKLTDAKAKAEAEAKAKAAAEAKAKAEAEAKRKAEEAKRLEEERKKAEAEAKRLAEEKAKADAEAKRKAEEAKRLEEERKRKEAEAAEKNKPVNLLDKNGVEWRLLTMSAQSARPTDWREDWDNHPSKPTIVIRGKDGVQNPLHHPDFANTSVDSPFINKSVNWINLNEESAKTGKPFLGVHQGSIKKDLPGEVVTSVEVDKSLERPNILTKDKVKQVNYIYVNQPYSSYGFLFTPEDNQSRSFVVFQPAAEQVDYWKKANFHHVVKNEEKSGASTGRIIWNDGIAGDATYKGELIAAYSTRISNTEAEVVAPHVDGTVTINAHFGNTWDKTTMSGEINSKKLGKMAFSNTAVNSYIDGEIGNKEIRLNRVEGGELDIGSPEAKVYFAGPNLNEAVGTVSTNTSMFASFNQNRTVRYEAVFGATKQSK